MSKLFEFTVTMVGWGDTPADGWEACKENFDIDSEPLPPNEIIDADDEE